MTRQRTSHVIGVGTRLTIDGALHEVVAFIGQRVVLVCASGERSTWEVPHLMRDRAVVFLDDGREAEATIADTAGPVGEMLAALTPKQMSALRDREAHVLEVLTGYRTRDPDTTARPREAFEPTRRLGERQAAKAEELGCSARKVRRWCDAYLEHGPVGLIDGRTLRGSDPLRDIDPRWIETCKIVIAQHTDASRPTQQILLERIDARLATDHGEGFVQSPKREKARRALRELARGTGALSGSTKSKRSIANRPAPTYGRLRGTRPGEYILLDTTRLDVFAMEPVTLKWVPVELTVAMDLYSRSIVGLRLTPVSTKGVDIAGVLYELTGAFATDEALPFVGLPETIFIPPAGGVDLPHVCPETLVIDHGKVYVSEHVRSVCSRLGISIQPARPYTPTDKAAIERFFRTLREQLLVALPGYKGPDVYSRGSNVEDEAYYFVDELEEIIRRWVVDQYMRRPHRGLVNEFAPGVIYSPQQRLEEGIARAGYLRIPITPDLGYDFLPVEWRLVQHYGVEIDGLRYNGEALDVLRNTTSPYGGERAGRWPFRVDPNNRQRIFVFDPNARVWQRVDWTEAHEVPQPFSTEVLKYARSLARKGRVVADTRLALRELLARWDAGRVANPTERRMWLRMSETMSAEAAGAGEREGGRATPDAPLEDGQATVTPLRPVRDGTDDPLVLVSDDDDLEDFYGDAFEVEQ